MVSGGRAAFSYLREPWPRAGPAVDVGTLALWWIGALALAVGGAGVLEMAVLSYGILFVEGERMTVGFVLGFGPWGLGMIFLVALGISAWAGSLFRAWRARERSSLGDGVAFALLSLALAVYGGFGAVRQLPDLRPVGFGGAAVIGLTWLRLVGLVATVALAIALIWTTRRRAVRAEVDALPAPAAHG